MAPFSRFPLEILKNKLKYKFCRFNFFNILFFGDNYPINNSIYSKDIFFSSFRFFWSSLGIISIIILFLKCKTITQSITINNFVISFCFFDIMIFNIPKIYQKIIRRYFDSLLMSAVLSITFSNVFCL